MGKLLLTIGVITALLGAAIVLLERLGGPSIGRLPGDIVVQRENFTFYLPIVSSLLLSVLLSLLLWGLTRFR